MKRVLSVHHYPGFGGPHNGTLRLMGPLRQRGWEIIALLPNEPGSAIPRYRDAGVTAVTVPLHRLRETFNPLVHAHFVLSFWREVWAIRRVIREQGIHLVMINGLENPHAAIAARLERVPVVWQILGTRLPMPLRRLLMPVATRLARVVMCTGLEVAREHPGALGLGDRLVPFFPPVDTSQFRPDPLKRSAARMHLGVPQEALLIGTVGILNRAKGHEYLIRASALLRDSCPTLFVRILGGSLPTHAAYEARLRQEAQACGLTDNGQLHFVDPGTHVAELLPAFDVFLLTSVPRSEGIPTVILEAMACGLPVVATDVGGVREVVEDGVTGLVVPPMEPEAVSQATLRLLLDPSLRSRMGDEAARRAVERYDVSACAETHVYAFERALAQR